MRDAFEQHREDMAVGEQYAYEGEPGLEPIVLADEYEREATERALMEYLAAVKQFGKALTKLGRRCDDN